MAEMLVPSQGTPRTRCFEHEGERVWENWRTVVWRPSCVLMMMMMMMMILDDDLDDDLADD